MSETQFFFVFILTILAMMAISSFLLNKALLYAIELGSIVLNPHQKKALKCGVSFLVTILTGHFCLLYLLLLR